MRKEKAFFYFFLLSVISFVCFLKIGSLSSTWDDGNIYYDSWRVLKGQIPNKDFISGYPGGHNLILATLMGIFGETVAAAQLYILMGALLLSSLTYFFLLKFIPPWLSAWISFIGTYISTLHHWCPLPALLGQVGFVSAMCLAYSIRKFDKNDLMKLFIAGTILGLSLCIRQASVFAVVGVAYMLIWRYFVRFQISSLSPVSLVFHGAMTAILLSFCYTRLHAGHPIFNYAVLLPWVATPILFSYAQWKTMQTGKVPLAETNRSYAVSSLVVFLSGLILGLFPIVIFYKTYRTDLAFVAHEIFVTIPKLIDRHTLPAKSIFTPDIILLTLACISYFSLRRTKNQSYFFCFIFSIWMLTLAYVSRVSLFEINLFWIGIFSFIWIMVRYLTDKKYSSEHMVFALACSPWLASMYPYPSTLYTACVVLILFCIALSEPLAKIAWKLPQLNKYHASFAVVACGLSCVVITKNFLTDTVKNDYSFFQGRSDKEFIPFFELSSTLNEIDPDATVSTYPNMAISLFFSKKLVPGRFGNYIGENESAETFIQDIVRNPPDIVIINRDLFPYPKGFPYFVPVEYIENGLNATHSLDKKIGHFDFYIHRK